MSKKINILNKKAKFNYELLSKYTAGIVLTGSEIKSIRQSKASISESFCKFDDNGELFIINMNIEEIITYDEGTCLDKKENPKNIGKSIQYIFFSFFIPNIKQ